MSRINWAAMAPAAAIAATLAAAPLPAEATKGFTDKQLRNYIKREIAKYSSKRGPIGPAGPEGAPGPAGADGMSPFYAYVGADGSIGEASGITQENVKRVDTPVVEYGAGRIDFKYCLTGLPPVAWGQVTVGGGNEQLLGPSLEITEDPECNPVVRIHGVRFNNMQSSFFIELY